MILNAAEIQQVNLNERDVEVPALISVLNKIKPASVLDIGASYSWYTYAPKVRELVPLGGYKALDLEEDLITSKIVDKYSVLDITSLAVNKQEKVDVTFSVSVLEHVGVKPVRVSNDNERRKSFVRTMLQLSNKAAFLTFPYGAGYWCEGQCIVFDNQELCELEKLAANYGFISECQFFCNPFPQGGGVWTETSREIASSVPTKLELGCTCLCLLLFIKRNK